MSKTYISYVSQSAQGHFHDFAIVDLPKSKFVIYKDTVGEEVFKSAHQKQLDLQTGEKLILISNFVINSN